MIAISTAAISSMNTPALLILAISFTPSALIRVVNDDQDGAEDDGVGGEVVLAGAVADDLEAAPDPRQVQLVGQHHRGERHDRRGQHQPARRPADEPTAELLRPVVDRSRDRDTCAASSMKHSATAIWPTKTIGHDHR